MPEVSPSKWLTTASWDDVPHIDEKTKAELAASYPPYMRDARMKGIPSLGAGAIYPIPWAEVIVNPFQIPVHWKRGYGLDVGWNFTAASWVAQDPSDGMLYVTAEYKASKQTPLIHATAIKMRGEWMHGAVDPASMGSNQADGTKLYNLYRNAPNNLNLHLANNEVDAGLDHIWSLLEIGRLKFFSTLVQHREEYQYYRRAKHTDKNEVETVKVVKKNDHLMDSDRYAIMTFDKIGRVKPAEQRDIAFDPPVAIRKTNY